MTDRKHPNRSSWGLTKMAPGEISPKAVLAAVVPALGGLVAVLVQWIATGDLDRPELATAVGTALASFLAFLGAYSGRPGPVVEDTGGAPPYSDTPGVI